MKKYIIVLAIIISILALNKHEKIIIPQEAIRFRIIANSNTREDQKLKREIIDNLSNTINETQQNKTIEEARFYIKNNLPKWEDITKKTLLENNKDNTIQVKYGMNYFPEKIYKNVIYPEGEYESLVITIGEGEGDNFWCVLFPPLCFTEEQEDLEYHSFIKEIINKYF